MSVCVCDMHGSTNIGWYEWPSAQLSVDISMYVQEAILCVCVTEVSVNVPVIVRMKIHDALPTIVVMLQHFGTQLLFVL